MSDEKDQLVDEDTMETMSVAPPEDPEERAFSGHPDHPPRAPDQTPEANQELLGENGGSAHDVQPTTDRH